jgi:hypothetical protein
MKKSNFSQGGGFNMANTLVSFPQGGQSMDIATGGRITGGTFLSTDQTATGGEQQIPHGLGVIPSIVLVIPTNTTPVTGEYLIVYTKDDTNINVTATADLVYVVYAWA